MYLLPRRRFAEVFALCFIAFGSAGCRIIDGELLPPKYQTPRALGFRAGAAKQDITPMPGYPMGGFSIGGRISRGVWTRLYARAVCLEDGAGRRLVFVACDLWSMPGGLADRAIELARSRYGAEGLGREDVILAATHTHHSPGNFSTSSFYNTFPSPKPGFDGELFDFLAQRIAITIGEACRRLEPVEVEYLEGDVHGLSRNRSLDAFRENSKALEIIRKNRERSADPSGRPRVPRTAFPVQEDAYFANDPVLRMLHASSKVDRRTVAVVAFAAVHPTVMGPRTEVYSSDLFGVATFEAERALAAAEQPQPVVACFNGPEGDLSANWNRQDRLETLRLGGQLAAAIVSEVQGSSGRRIAPTDEIFSRMSVLDLKGVARPMFGAPVMAGSEADWTVLYDLGWNEGLREIEQDRWIPGHPFKIQPLAPILDGEVVTELVGLLLEHVTEVPEVARVGLHRVGPIVFATLPGEFTTVLGDDFRESLLAATRAEAVVLVGLANEYLSYFTTEAEHGVQHYEGASMAYGPASGDAVGSELQKLAASDEGPRGKTLFYSYRPGSSESFGARELSLIDHLERLQTSFYALDNVLVRPDALAPAPYFPHVLWSEEDPTWSSCRTRVTPRVWIEEEASSPSGEAPWRLLVVGGIPMDDNGPFFVTTLVTSFLGTSHWISRWLVTPEMESDPELKDRPLRFHIEGTSDSYVSKPFRLATLMASGGRVGRPKAIRDE